MIVETAVDPTADLIRELILTAERTSNHGARVRLDFADGRWRARLRVAAAAWWGLGRDPGEAVRALAYAYAVGVAPVFGAKLEDLNAALARAQAAASSAVRAGLDPITVHGYVHGALGMCGACGLVADHSVHAVSP